MASEASAIGIPESGFPRSSVFALPLEASRLRATLQRVGEQVSAHERRSAGQRLEVQEADDLVYLKPDKLAVVACWAEGLAVVGLE